MQHGRLVVDRSNLYRS